MTQWQKLKNDIISKLMTRKGRVINLLAASIFGFGVSAVAKLGLDVDEDVKYWIMAVATLGATTIIDGILVIMAGDSNTIVQENLHTLDSAIQIDGYIRPNGQTMAAVKTLVTSISEATNVTNGSLTLSVPSNNAAVQASPIQLRRYE